ncbi:hypothetical protein F383_36433 [Gossypium arboreum]|uniref:Uncharacterized protein n=1 Tax=Gossypium arboreum TaxID=29729 RepID=A0A0B0Q0Q6_GOSAR|nr:hypothetical protein F383_36433 [Gossypium arboreum]
MPSMYRFLFESGFRRNKRHQY